LCRKGRFLAVFGFHKVRNQGHEGRHQQDVEQGNKVVAMSGASDDIPLGPQAGYIRQRQVRQRHHACASSFFGEEARPQHWIVPSGSIFLSFYDFS
jgi:hypothetical protein